MKNIFKIVILVLLFPVVSFAADAEFDRRCHCDGDVKISYTPPFFDNNGRGKETLDFINDHINNSRRKYIYCQIRKDSDNEKDNYRLIGDFESVLDVKFMANTKSYTNTCE